MKNKKPHEELTPRGHNNKQKNIYIIAGLLTDFILALL